MSYILTNDNNNGQNNNNNNNNIIYHDDSLAGAKATGGSTFSDNIKKNDDGDKESMLSAFETTNNDNNNSNTKRRRKSSFFNQGSATIFSSMMNLCNTVIGAGILALPETMVHTGWVLGFILLIMFAIASITTLHLSMMAGYKIRKLHNNNIRLSYLVMCNSTLPSLKKLVDFSVGITCFGVCCAYLVVIGDLMPDVASQIIDRTPNQESTLIEDIFESRELWIIIFLIIFIIPTTHLRNMDALRFTSTAAIICFTYVTIIVVCYAFIDDLQLCDPKTYTEENYTKYCTNNEIYEIPIESGKDLLLLFKAAPTIIFAYTCHQNSFSVINELRSDLLTVPTSLNKIVFGSITICCVIYMIVAFSGYISFGESAPSNLLTAYPQTIPILIVRVCLSFAIAFSYPVLAYPARNSFSSLIFNISDTKQLNWIQYNLITFVIIIISFIISMSTNDLGIVLALVGSTGTTIIAFILPGAFYYNLPTDFDTNKNDKYKRQIALIMMILGIVLVPFNITMIFVEP